MKLSEFNENNLKNNQIEHSVFFNIKSEHELLEYMNKNINYGFLGKNEKIYSDSHSKEFNNDWYLQCILQSGERLLDTKYGTCWDQVELERLWFEKNNYEFKTIFIWFEKNESNNLPTHTFLIYKKNEKWYWFEHSFETVKGIHEFRTEEEAINCVKQKQLEYAMSNGRATISDQYYLKSYEYTKPAPNLGVNDYLKHVTSSMLKMVK